MVSIPRQWDKDLIENNHQVKTSLNCTHLKASQSIMINIATFYRYTKPLQVGK